MGSCESKQALTESANDTPIAHAPEEQRPGKEDVSENQPIDQKPLEPLRILVSGQRQAGCTTVVNHLRRNYGQPRSKEELNSLTQAIQSYANQLASKLCEKNGETGRLNKVKLFHVSIGPLVDPLWADPTVKRLWRKYWKYEIQTDFFHDDSSCIDSEYFLDHLSRILQPNYVPTEDDILQFHVATKQPITHSITLGTQQQCLLLDVPLRGLNHQNKDPPIDTFVFVVDLSSYDRQLHTGSHHNRNNELYQTFEIFAHHVNQPRFLETSLYLLLNKKDQFVQKIQQGIPIGQQQGFGDYVGPHPSPGDGQLYFLHKFRNSVRNNNRLQVSKSLCLTIANETDAKQTMDAICKSIAADTRKRGLDRGTIRPEGNKPQVATTTSKEATRIKKCKSCSKKSMVKCNE